MLLQMSMSLDCEPRWGRLPRLSQNYYKLLRLCALRWGQDGAKTEPREAKREPKWGQEGAKIEPKERQDDAGIWSQKTLKKSPAHTPILDPKMDPKMGPRTVQKGVRFWTTF